MARTPTKNPNLWSDSRLQLEYNKVCRELYELVEIAKQVKEGSYDGPKRGLLDKNNLVNILKRAKQDVLGIEEWIKKREKVLIAKNQPSPFKLIKMNRDNPVVYGEPLKKPQDIEVDSSLEELMQDIFK